MKTQKGVAGTGVKPVPIDIRITRQTRVVTITGPNTGGKTAALKALGCVTPPPCTAASLDGTLAGSLHGTHRRHCDSSGRVSERRIVGSRLTSLMAKAGLYLPALEARLPWFDNVFADIGDEQSLEASLSTFSGHLKTTLDIRCAPRPA